MSDHVPDISIAYPTDPPQYRCRVCGQLFAPANGYGGCRQSIERLKDRIRELEAESVRLRAELEAEKRQSSHLESHLESLQNRYARMSQELEDITIERISDTLREILRRIEPLKPLVFAAMETES